MFKETKSNLNRTRLECKDSLHPCHLRALRYLNRTRLECKEFKAVIIKCKCWIWIEPDWNVKLKATLRRLWDMPIWIEPDWNVKITGEVDFVTDFSIWIEPDWNVKEIRYTNGEEAKAIWIEPDWNVKKTLKAVLIEEQGYLNRTRLECKVQLDRRMKNGK